jgi:hypothetical protein
MRKLQRTRNNNRPAAGEGQPRRPAVYAIEPFGEGVWHYVDAGWGVVPVDGKKPLVTGYTGHAGGWADTKTLMYWAEYYAAANIALRLPDGLIGIDCDLYKFDLEGRRAEFLKRLALPPSYRSSAREDGSGISIYRVPPGLRFQGEPAPGIEIIQFHHRVATCWPSMRRL